MSTRNALGGLCLLTLLAMSLSSCSDDDSLLNWNESNRGGLGEPADTLNTAAVVTANATFWEPQATGRTGYYLVGRLDRAGLVEGATAVFSDAYLKWDLASLPDGEVVSAKLEFVVHDLDEAGTTPPESFNLRLFEVTEAWEEDSLGLYHSLPATGATSLGNSGTFDLSALTDTSDVSLPEMFVSPGNSTLSDLVNQWLEDPATNHGVVIRASDEADEQGFLRFVAREGAPLGEAYEEIEIDWPKLTVEIEIEPGDVQTQSLTASEDGYQMYGSDGRGGFQMVGGSGHAGGPGLAGGLLGMDPETQLLLSSGYVQPLIFKIDLDSLMAAEPDRFPDGLAVHQATLTLTQVMGDEWSMAEGEELSLQVFETPTEWTEDDPPEPGEIEGPLVSSTTIEAEDETITLDIRDTVQQLVEGEELSIVVLTEAGTSVFRTILFQGRTASTGVPEVRLIFTRPSDGRIPVELEQGGGQR